ncbi:U3 small nucleolar ribonucleoprotein protein MPP10 [Diachasma alloeum]|uniref:U3 small nucleolar ribonucleoprotein protein MPP10 n=1 Tax=Diachasma alloeum TaxID=454923 RepID=UPI0007384D0A|nr:U3 small nucleolar ribonucleoprotein protein MPP10 [Diachasma alloeum]
MNTLENVIQIVGSNTKKAENYLSAQNNVALQFQQSTKLLYDFTKHEAKRNTAALPELVIQDFDEEQIWQQLEIQNEVELTHFLTGVSRVLAGSSQLSLPVSSSKAEEPLNSKNAHSPEDAENEEESEEMLEGSGSDSDDMDLDIDVDGNLNKTKKVAKVPKKPSVVDDKFFKLEELDEYLMKEEKKESKLHPNPDESDESDDEPVDLFNDDSGMEEDDDDEAKMVKYAGFFDSPESDNEHEATNDETNESLVHSDAENDRIKGHKGPKNSETLEKGEKSGEKRVKFNLTNDSDDSDSIEHSKIEGEEPTSTLEARQERLQKRIKELEEQALSEKPWQLKGEIAGSSRPQNSLLEEFVEFDITSRPAPVITEQTSLKLEDIIKQRIKDKAWDDVQKKFKPVETPVEYKKKLVMDQEKSQKSLAQIYEDAYLKQKEALSGSVEEKEEEEPKEHKEIRELMHSLFTKLDALSNFHYTPKLAQPEIKIISNIPAINMEEVAPVAISDAALLAPEEVKDNARGDIIGKSERTKTDMKRARRKKKLAQREKQKASEKKERTLGDLLEMKKNKLAKSKKSSKSAQDSAIKKLTKDRNISKINEASQRVPKSSTAFFTQLQDEVSSHIKSKSSKPTKKKEKAAHSAIKLKL